MAEALGPGCRVLESPRFLLLTTMPERAAGVFLDSCEAARRRILRFLDGIARDRRDGGKHVVLVFDDQDDYYDYASHFQREGGEYSMSSGMFIHAGYGHFVVWSSDMQTVEPVIAHELTHCLVAELPIPTWLNEGMAVNIERRMFPHLAHPDMQEYSPAEMQVRRERFWNAETIQAFWSGTLFEAAGEGNALAYDLATRITALAGHDYPAFRAFALQAHRDDGGRSAEAILGHPLAHLVEAVLGDGGWAPDPARWQGRTASGLPAG